MTTAELTEKEIADRLAELQLSFPVVAPRLLMNLELDRDLYHGFTTSVQKTMAKYQVPYLLEQYLSLGVFVPDSARKCGYRAQVKYRITDQTGKNNEQKAAYLKDFASVVSERIAEGNHSRMAAATFVMTHEQYSEVVKKIMPTLREIRSVEPGPDTVGVRILFCALKEETS